MRIPVPLRDFLLVSLPLLLLLAVLEAVSPSTRELMWAMRLHKSENPLARQVMFWITDWSNFAIYAFYVLLLMRALARGQRGAWRRVLIFAAVQLAVCLVLLTGVKMVLGRPRPVTGLEIFDFFTLNPHFHSLPSGHTAEITGSCMPLALHKGRPLLSLALGCVVALVGFSRIYLNEHYPGDVFFGWAFGAFAGCLTASLWKQHA
ncbi:MAG: phosphatase PAP2 family protein [Thermodesulfobacteriota bacterium]